jgi:capsid protein
MIGERGSLGLTYQRTVRAGNVLAHGWYDRVDQVRGISPLAAAINPFQDIMEASEYALARMKLSQLFGLKIPRRGDEPLDGIEADGEGDDAPAEVEPYQFDFKGGPQLLDLEEGDDANFLESQQPAGEFQSFMAMMIQASLKSLDLDMSFFDSSHTNYSGARQALLSYQKSARVRQAEVRDLLRRITAWRLSLFVADGDLVLPTGMTLADLKWEWLPSGWGWIDPLKEAKAHIAEVEAGLTSRTRIARERGVDWLDIADELQAEQAAAADRGLALSMPDLGPLVDPDDLQEAA